MKKSEDVKTCQVCGRGIKAGKGVIAHHGFERPYWGGQTASCKGALYLPYEVSCERLREVIGYVEAYLANQEQGLEELLTNPPATITRNEKRGSYGKDDVRTYEKPVDFNPKSYFGGMYTYADAYAERKSRFIMTIRSVQADLETMRRRLADWVPAKREEGMKG